jgi:hypothetical protein
MKKIFFLSTLVLLASQLFFSACSCKRTVEGEVTSWQRNESNVRQARANYPGFAAAIDQVFNEANTKWQAAQQIGNDEEKIQAMSAANGIITNSFIGRLDEIKSTTDRLNQDMQNLGRNQVPSEYQTRLFDIMRRVTIAQTDCSNILLRGGATVNEAENNTRMALEPLNNAKRDLDQLQSDISNAQSKQNANKNTNNNTDNTTNSNSNSNTNTSVEQSWKCAYCSTQNTTGAVCSSCGATK